MCISERLKQVLDAKNMTVTEFSNVTGISYRSAMNYLNEGRDPNVDALVKIYKGLGVSITWLLTGEGAIIPSIIQRNSILEQDTDIIGIYREFPEHLKYSFINFLKSIHTLNKEKQHGK